MHLPSSEYGHIVQWAPANKYLRVTAYNAYSEITVDVHARTNSCYIPGGDFTDLRMPEGVTDVIVTPQLLPLSYKEYPSLIVNTSTGSGIPRTVTSLTAGNVYLSETTGFHKAEIILAAPYALIINNLAIEAYSPLRIAIATNSIQVIPTITSLGKFTDCMLEEAAGEQLEIIYV